MIRGPAGNSGIEGSCGGLTCTAGTAGGIIEAKP
jgi:hypothetical protein